MNRASDNNAVDATAAVWAVRLGEGLSPAQQGELDAWLARDSRHVCVLVRAEAAWSDVDRVAALNRGRPARPSRRLDPRRYWKPASLAAGLLAAALVGGGVIYDQLAGRYAADAGEVRRILLDDGSIVTLNTDSSGMGKRPSRSPTIRGGRSSCAPAICGCGRSAPSSSCVSRANRSRSPWPRASSR